NPAPPPSDPAGSPVPASPPVASAPVEDPYLWLEQIEDGKSLDWAKARDAESKSALEAVPGFEDNRQRVLAIMNAKDKVPSVYKQGTYLYNFWTDATNPRGLWRRTTLAQYARDKPAWEVIIDVDALNKAEKASWVWHG